jgi:hypothetical protein
LMVRPYNAARVGGRSVQVARAARERVSAEGVGTAQDARERVVRVVDRRAWVEKAGRASAALK